MQRNLFLVKIMNKNIPCKSLNNNTALTEIENLFLTNVREVKVSQEHVDKLYISSSVTYIIVK